MNILTFHHRISRTVTSTSDSFASSVESLTKMTRFRYFGYFHILAIFIVLGIGADDLFVFYDAWRASGTKVFPSLSHRLWEAFKKSAISMLITSLTTMVSDVTHFTVLTDSMKDKTVAINCTIYSCD